MSEITTEAGAVRSRLSWVFFAVLIAGILAGGYWILFKRDPLPPEIRIAAGAKGGLYHRLAEQIAIRMQATLGRPVRVLETKGTGENREKLLSGGADVALFQAGGASMDGLAGLAPLYPDAVFVIVRKGSSIRSVDQMSGRAISIGPQGSGTRTMAVGLLAQFGVDPASLKQSERYFADLLTNPDLEGAIVTAGLLNQDLERLMATRQFEILPISDGPALAVRERTISPYTVPRGVFAQGPPVPDRNIPTISTTAMLVSRMDAPPRLVSLVLDAIYRGDLQMDFPIIIEESEAKTRTIYPVHPAARKYHNPYEGLDTLSNFMESMSAGKELLVALGAAIYVIWDQSRRRHLRRQEKEFKVQREKLDAFLNETVQIERRQIGCWEASELRTYLEQVTQLKLDALESLTEEKLREDRMFLIFITQCGGLISKMQNKLLYTTIAGSASPPKDIPGA